MDKISFAKNYNVGISNVSKTNNGNQNTSKAKLDASKDEFSLNPRKDLSNDGKFSAKEALKNFGKGIISPITTVIKHPIATVSILAGAGLACFAVPVLTPILTVGFGALSLCHLGKSTINTIKDYSNGNYDNAEKGFKGIGEGMVGTLTTLLGLKSSAKIAVEAKVIAKSGPQALDAVAKNKIASQISQGGLKGALKQHFDLLFTKNGLKAVLNQFKPSTIKSRFSALRAAGKGVQNNPSSREALLKKFQESPEGIRRAKLTPEQLKAEIQNKYNQVFDELGIPKEQRPVLKVENADIKHCGAYSARKHELMVNPEAYKAGVMELDDVLMHEATHCKEALLRAGLPKAKVDQIIRDNLIARISGGENEKIIMSGDILGPVMMKPPKLTSGMQKDFISFAKNHLYKSDDVFTNDFRKYISAKEQLVHKASPENLQAVKVASQKVTSLIDDLHALVDKHPEFVNAYKTKEEAIIALEQYALSHQVRYKLFTNNTIPGITPKSLTLEQMKFAEKSLNNYVDTLEGNAANQGIFSMFGGKKQFNQYQFSPEEVLSQKNGQNFVIKNFKAKLAELKKNGTLTPETEAYLTGAIKKAEATIAYKTKGLEYYEVYRKMINNPADKALAAKVNALEQELNVLAQALRPEEVARIQKFVMQTAGVPQNIWPVIATLEK